MRIGFDAKRLFNNFTGLGNHSRTTIDILTAEFPDNEYWLYTPKVRLNGITLPYLGKKGCRLVKPEGLMRGSAWRTYGLVADMKRDGIEVFHGLSNEMPVGLFHSGIASVVTIHDVAFRTFPDMYHWHDRKIYDMSGSMPAIMPTASSASASVRSAMCWSSTMCRSGRWRWCISL
jgi:hypothetical protein